MPTDVVSRNRPLRRISGISGIIGGLVLSGLGLGESLAGAQSNLLALTGFGLVAVCEIGLVRELARVHRDAARVLASVFTVGAVVASVGFWSLLTAGSVLGVGLAALGFMVLFFLAPVAALGCARAGLLAVLPASTLAALSVVALLASVTKNPLLILVTQVPYTLSWVWLGFALLAPLNPLRGSSSAAARGASNPKGNGAEPSETLLDG